MSEETSLERLDREWNERLQKERDEYKEEMLREKRRKEDLQKLIDEFCGEHLGFEQGRLATCGNDENVISLRRRNNVDRPTGYGALIDDLLTTIMIGRMKQRKEIKALQKDLNNEAEVLKRLAGVCDSHESSIRSIAYRLKNLADRLEKGNK
jgi:hypothetical protein